MAAKKTPAKKPAKKKAPKTPAPKARKQGVVCDIPAHEEKLVPYRATART